MKASVMIPIVEKGKLMKAVGSVANTTEMMKTNTLKDQTQ